MHDLKETVAFTIEVEAAVDIKRWETITFVSGKLYKHMPGVNTNLGPPPKDLKAGDKVKFNFITREG